MNQHTPLLETDRTTFCTVLINQNVHIYGLKQVGEDTTLHHVDEISISPTRCSDVELGERLRLVMALFTIKRYVCNVAERLRTDIGGIANEDSTDTDEDLTDTE